MNIIDRLILADESEKLTAKLSELYKHCTEIRIAPHNPNIQGAITAELNVFVYSQTGKKRFAQFYCEADTIELLIKEMHYLVMSFYDVVNKS